MVRTHYVIQNYIFLVTEETTEYFLSLLAHTFFVLVLPSVMSLHVMRNLLRLCQCKQTSGEFNIWHAATYSANVFLICQYATQESNKKTKQNPSKREHLNEIIFFKMPFHLVTFPQFHSFFRIRLETQQVFYNVNITNDYFPHFLDAAISAYLLKYSTSRSVSSISVGSTSFGRNTSSAGTTIKTSTLVFATTVKKLPFKTGVTDRLVYQ